MGVRERGSGARGSDERVGEKEAGDDSFPLEPPANRTRTSGETGHPSFLNDRGGTRTWNGREPPSPSTGTIRSPIESLKLAVPYRSG